MKILAFMQNQWFHNPESARSLYGRYGRERHHELNAFFLFRGCKSGRMLRAHLGKELCDKIIWEESSKEIGGHASAKFTADPFHIENCIRLHLPDAVIAFGKIAAAAKEVIALNDKTIPFVECCHPAARHNGVVRELQFAAAELNKLMIIHGHTNSK